MKFKKPALAAVAFGVAALLAACGGGGGGTASSANPPVVTPPVQSDLAVTVVDGPIKNAKVCLDRNTNGACDAGEPSGTTDAAGQVTLKVDAADVGKFPIVAEVGTDAVDADNPGATVATRFVLRAPADRQAVVSPLTTLVQMTAESTGSTSAAAEASLKVQIGASGSLFDDFTKGTAAEAARLATLARMIVATTQEQTRQLAPAVGTAALDGATIGQRDLEKAVQQRVLQALPAVVATLSDPRLDTANKGAVISTIAQELVASPSVGLNTSTLATLVAAARSPDTTEASTAGGNLRDLNYTNATNWTRRVFTTSAAQAQPDSNGMTVSVDRRERNAGGNLATWSFNGDPVRQGDFHFNGSNWVQCPFNMEIKSTARDAQGRSSYDFCDKFETGSSVRVAQDIAGRTMVEVYGQIRTAGYTNVTITNAATALGTATFPAGSKLFNHINTALTTAPTYVPNMSARVRNHNADIAAGGNATAACLSVVPGMPFESYTTRAATLESIVARNRGTPCVFTPNDATGPRNEWWTQSTLNVSPIAAPPGTTTPGTFYTNGRLLRVGFGDNNVVKYYSCLARASDGSVRNCDQVGTGTYTIETLGDARVMRLGNEPALFTVVNFQRIFVERGGQVYFGFQNRPSVTTSARLNLAAANALFTQLGLSSVDPEVPMAKTPGSYVGDWFLSDTNPLDLADGLTVRVDFSGTAFSCSDPASTFTCSLSLTPATGAFTLTLGDGSGTATGTMNSATSAVTGTFTPTGGAGFAFTGMRR